MKKNCGVIDSTLREGEQAPGVKFCDHVRRNILSRLYEIGVDEIELGIASPLNVHIPGLVDAARDVISGDCRLALWSRCVRKDISFAGRCKPDVLSLSIPASDLHITRRLRKDRGWVLRKLSSSIDQAVRCDIPYISVGFEDSSRADPEFLVQLGKVAEESGARRIRLADTVGVCTPAIIGRLVKEMRQHVSLDIGVHCHNDFGMATGNSMAALESGAKWVDATVLGLGERAGNCRLEEICASLVLLSRKGKYAIERIPELCEYVAAVSRRSIPDNHPLVGKKIFTCETGLHQHGLAVSGNTYEPFSPRRIGRKRTLLFGKKAGRRGLVLQLEKAGIYLDEPQIRSLLRKVRSGDIALDEKQLTEFTIEHFLS